MRISDWRSDVCYSDLGPARPLEQPADVALQADRQHDVLGGDLVPVAEPDLELALLALDARAFGLVGDVDLQLGQCSEERRAGKDSVRTCSSRALPYH